MSIRWYFRGHPENKVPGVEASTGSLGHGLVIGVGMAVAAKINNLKNKVYVILGDGKLMKDQYGSQLFQQANII